MIEIKEKKSCCGCFSCLQRCPKKCISFYEDEEGFLYPKVNLDLCIDCGLCENVCPVLHQSKEKVPIAVYAAKNPDDQIREQSSSGGIFTLLAEYTIDRRGVVFGVKWNESFEAVHAYTETKDGLADFRGCKYVQSQVGETYKQTMHFLQQGRQVLYSGTPCQIAALKLFLGRDYDNLITVDIICHGVPSPGVFRWYLSEELSQLAKSRINEKKVYRLSSQIPVIPKSTEIAKSYGVKIKDIRFRDKSKGWKRYSFVISYNRYNNVLGKSVDGNLISYSKTFDNNMFMKGFLRDLYLRPSCHFCPAKSGKSGADITIGDYWGIKGVLPEFDDDKGVSAITVNTVKGQRVLHSTIVNLHSTTYENLCLNNSALLLSCPVSLKRNLFFADNEDTFSHRIKKLCNDPFIQRLTVKMKSFLKKVFYAISKFIK